MKLGRPGILKHRVEIQANAPTASDYGENAESWSAVETVWADVEPVSIREMLHGGQATGLVTHRVRMRYREDLGTGDVEHSPSHRLVYDSRTFEIVGVQETERRRYVMVEAHEVTT